MNLFDVTKAYANKFFVKKDFEKALIFMLAAEIINSEGDENDKESDNGEKQLQIETTAEHCTICEQNTGDIPL